jgi:hypothetical protein
LSEVLVDETLADKILAEASQASERKASNWFDAIPEEHRATLLLVRQRFQATRQATKTLPIRVAENICRQFEPLGCKLPANKRTVAGWLTSN